MQKQQQSRTYLSYSQFSVWRDGKGINDYIRIYFEGQRLSNKYLTFGSKIADGLEKREEESNDLSVIKAREIIPKPQFSEREFWVNFGGIQLMGRLDGLNINPEIVIDEYKTAKTFWTQKQVDTAEQLTFYAIFVSEELKVNPEDIKIKLRCLETIEDLSGNLMLTGRHKVFETRRTKTDIINIYPRIKNAWNGITELKKRYYELKNN